MFAATRNHVQGQSASSESDLSRYRTLFQQKKSSSFSNMTESKLKVSRDCRGVWSKLTHGPSFGDGRW